MSRLPADKEQELLAILRERGQPFDEHQACLDFAGALERLELLAREGNRPGKRRPHGDLRILVGEAAQLYHHHTRKVLGRTVKALKSGGRDARFVMLLAHHAGILDPKIDESAKLKIVASTIKEVQDALSAKAGLPKTAKFKRLKDDDSLAAISNDEVNDEVHSQRHDKHRDKARGDILEPHVIRYENEEGEPVTDPHDGHPVLEGYEAAPDHSRISKAQRAAATKHLKTQKG